MKHFDLNYTTNAKLFETITSIYFGTNVRKYMYNIFSPKSILLTHTFITLQ